MNALNICTSSRLKSEKNFECPIMSKICCASAVPSPRCSRVRSTVFLPVSAMRESISWWRPGQSGDYAGSSGAFAKPAQGSCQPEVRTLFAPSALDGLTALVLYQPLTSQIGFAGNAHIGQKMRQLREQQGLRAVDQSGRRIRVKIHEHHVGS